MDHLLKIYKQQLLCHEANITFYCCVLFLIEVYNFVYIESITWVKECTYETKCNFAEYYVNKFQPATGYNGNTVGFMN